MSRLFQGMADIYSPLSPQVPTVHESNTVPLDHLYALRHAREAQKVFLFYPTPKCAGCALDSEINDWLKYACDASIGSKIKYFASHVRYSRLPDNLRV